MKIQIVLTVFWLLLFLTVSKLADNLQITNILQASNFIELVLLSCKVSFFACLWVFVLTEQSNVFGWVRSFLFGIIESLSTKNGKVNQLKRHNLNYILKPFLTCEKCTTGNLAFWAYVSCNQSIVILDLLFVISVSVFITIISTPTWQK
jgi:hypothetical protein